MLDLRRRAKIGARVSVPREKWLSVVLAQHPKVHLARYSKSLGVRVHGNRLLYSRPNVRCGAS